MEDNVNELIELGDPTAKVTEVITDDNTKYVFIEKKEPGMYCPCCGKRMLSKGIRTKEVNHPVLQSGFNLILVLKVRKWHCRDCDIYDHDHYTFVQDGKRNSSLVPLMILNKMKSLEVTARHVAAEMNISDTYVFETFMRYVNLDRLEFTEVISIDEVHMKFDKDDLYSVVIMDFLSGQIIDILPNRHKDTFEEYFLHIPLEERRRVKVIISDMYKPYLRLPEEYFPNAVSLIDSFHVISMFISAIHRYVNQVKRRYQERDDRLREEKNYRSNKSYKTMKKSWEVKLLERYEWFLTKNHDDISYTPYYRHIRGVSMWFNPASVEKAFMVLDPYFVEIRDLKEMYVKFNKEHVNDPAGALESLYKIIAVYEKNHLSMYREIASTLKEHAQKIANSFLYIASDRYEENQQTLRRLSNGPMEGFNVNPKNLKRISRGVANFEYTRNRILWATRIDPPLLAVPRSDEEIHQRKGKHRGSYKTKSK